jgi:hypothetical protein
LPEQAWLDHIGTGTSQTDRVCGRGATDGIATALCAQPRPQLTSLEDLYRVLGLDREHGRFVAGTTHSLGLSSRIVSAANPRVFVFPNTSIPNLKYEQVVVASFTRGEQLVELVGLDPATYEYNFYLLRFEQSCNESRCTPVDLLTEDIEQDWTDWTLYSEHDLEDTPLDCVSCHLPFGPGTHKLLLMRQVFDPWMHWGDFRGGDERSLCPDPPKDGRGEVVAEADGLDLIVQLEGEKGRYGGIPVRELDDSKSGELFANLLVNAEQKIRSSPYPDYPYEQLALYTREVLCERFHTGTSPTWDQARAASQERGLPVPYYAPDLLAPSKREALVSDRSAFLEARLRQEAPDVAASLLAKDVPSAVGFVPREQDPAPEILQSMCVRCHAANTKRVLHRARFNVEAVDHIEPDVAKEVVRRLRLPRSSAELMPPWRSGELPEWAIERVEAYLREHCTEPGGCG